jgi:geranylgeranyl diphosphate synthase, type II
LLGCSLQMGAINAGANNKDQLYLFEFGKHLGIAFQLLDDYLDVFAADPKKFGKQAGGDILSNKKTFLLVKAIEAGGNKHLPELRRLLELKDKNTEKVQGVLALYHELGIKELCRQEADKHTKMAIEQLNSVKASPNKKESLKVLALDLLNREV